MPLMYLPLIMYASWMEFLAQPFKANVKAIDRDQLPDPYPDETAEWLTAINDVLENQGRQRARYLLTRILHLARQRQIGLPSLLQTDYINSIPPEQEPYFPGNERHGIWSSPFLVTVYAPPGGVTAKIKSKMALDDHVKARSISVETAGSVVTLTGIVDSSEERDRALRLAKDTDGVTRVVDKLEIKKPAR